MSSCSEQRWTPIVLVTGAAATLCSSVPLGFQMGVMNTAEHVIRAWCNASITERYHYALSTTQLDSLWSCIVSVYMFGGFMASFAASTVADRLGRKKALLVINALWITAALLFVSSRYVNSVEMLVVGRFVSGLSAGLTLGIVSLYLTEIGSVTQRGALGTLTELGTAFGVVLSQVLGFSSVLGTESTWHYLLAAHSIFNLIASLAMPFLPESPKYMYVFRGDQDGCIKELLRLRGVPVEDLQGEMDVLSNNYELERMHKDRHTLWSVARSPELRIPLLLVFALYTGQMLSGIDALEIYSTSVFEGVGLSSQTSQCFTLGLGIVELIMCGVSVVLNSYYGRRKLVLTSFILMASLETVLMISLFVDPVTWTPYLYEIIMAGTIFAFCIGLASIPHFIANELFIVGPASVAMSYASMTYWAMDIVVGMVFPVLEKNIPDLAFLPSVITLVITGTFVWKYLPETKDRNPADIAALLKHGFASKRVEPRISVKEQNN